MSEKVLAIPEMKVLTIPVYEGSSQLAVKHRKTEAKLFFSPKADVNLAIAQSK